MTGLRRRSALALLSVLALASLSHTAVAQSKAPVVVMVEPGGGLPSAEIIGAELSHEVALRIVSLRDVSPSAPPPQAIVTLAIDRDHLINAVYWDRAGRFEVLSAPVKSNMASAHIESVAITLASALLQRHIVELTRGIVPDPAFARRAGKDGQLDMADASRFLYDALGRLGLLRRRTIELSIDEF